jgi:serine protease Do
MQIRPLIVALWSVLTLTPGTLDAQPVRDAFRRANPSVVLIRTTGRAATPGSSSEKAAQAQGVGSGVLVSADGKVVTAAHVVKSEAAIEVSFLDGEPIQASVVWMAPSADLALLQLARVPPAAVVATFGNSDLLETGDQVFTIGAPYGANHSRAVGWVSARRLPSPVYEDATPLELLQTDLSVFGGNSGGPLLNVDGEVVGIVTHVLSGDGAASGPSFSVAGNVVKRLLLDERRTWFGVESFMLEGPLAEAFNLPQPAGLLVQSVSPASLAAKLGLRGGTVQAAIADVPVFLGGDVLIEILGVPVVASPRFMSTFLAALDKVTAGDTVTARVWRAGRVVSLDAVVPSP